MFTGIVGHVGQIRRIGGGADSKKLSIDLGPLAEGLGEGDSVAVCGTCLTACAIRGSEADFDAITETLSRTTLGGLRVGAKVNLERAMRVSDAFDGHIVQGHVDGIAEVRSMRRGRENVIEFSAGSELTDQMVPKGSICIDGVSLTLASAGKGVFSVALIPTTLAETTIGELTAGSKVNIETDVIGKYVLKYLGRLAGDSGGGLTLDKLTKAGFFNV